MVVVAPLDVRITHHRLSAAIDTAAGAVSTQGLVCVVVDRRHRGLATRALARAGLELQGVFVLTPGWPGTEHLVELDAAALPWVASHRFGWPDRVVAVVARVLRFRVLRAVAVRAVPSCALVASRGSRLHLAGWLGDVDGSRVGSVALSATDHGHGRVAVAFRFRPGSVTPDVAAKVALDPQGAERVRREQRSLSQLGASASRAGAMVPTIRRSDDGSVVTEAVPGRPAAATLARRPTELRRIGSAVVRWLERWNRETAQRRTASPELLDRLVLAPMRRTVDAGVLPLNYADVVHALVGEVAGTDVVLVAVHGDLTMANVLHADVAISVVDWEDGRRLGLPLTDLWYALSDAVARARGATHAAALGALAHGSVPQPLAAAAAGIAAALQLTPVEQALAFHATWLGHAADEVERGLRDGPFLAVARAVADGRVGLAGTRLVST